MMKNLISIAEVARRAGCSYQNAWFWTQNGKLETVRDEKGKLLGVVEASAKKMIDYFQAKRAILARVKGE